MASSTDFSKKYARAFLEAISDLNDKDLKKVSDELEKLSFLSEDPLLSFLLNPVFQMEEKQAVLEDLLKKVKLREETKQFVLTLLSLEQVHVINEVSKHFVQLLDERNEQMRVALSSAYALKAPEKEKIKAALEESLGKKVLLDVVVDPSLIGGIRAQIGGVIYDSSIQGHLKKLEKEFVI